VSPTRARSAPAHRPLPAVPTRRSSDLSTRGSVTAPSSVGRPAGAAGRASARSRAERDAGGGGARPYTRGPSGGKSALAWRGGDRAEEHTSGLQSRFELVCRLLLEKKKV